MVKVHVCIQSVPESAGDQCSARLTDESGRPLLNMGDEWYLSADSLTTGMLVDLLLCLDQLGFVDNSSIAEDILHIEEEA